MISLTQLPNEVLAHLLHGSDVSYLVITLWKTGDTNLLSKLARSITHVSLKDDNETSTSRWPKCLSMLRNLQYLSVERYGGYLMGSSVQLAAELRQLSPKLRLLHLDSMDAPTAFYNYAEDGSLIPTRYARGLSRLFDMTATFPVLETLQVQALGPDPIMRPKISIPGQDFAGLPDSLTSLITDSIIKVNPSYLPRGLLSIDSSLDLTSRTDFTSANNDDDDEDAEQEELSPSLVARLPPNLTSVTRIYGLDTAEQLRSLPKSFESLHDSIHWTYANSRALPPSIRLLTIAMIDHASFEAAHTHWAAELPRALSTLNVRGSVQLGAKDILSLPSSLTTIDEVSINWADCEAYEGLGLRLPWPPSLTLLELEDLVAPAHFRFLPPNIADIYVSGWQVDQPSGSQSLKTTSFPNLTALRFGYERPQVQIESLPTGLTTLDLGLLRRTHMIGVAVLQHLPAPLTRLRLNLDEDIDTSEDMVFCLPLGLRHARLTRWHFSWLEKFPNGLEELTICRLLGFTKEVAHLPDFTSALPTSLIRLSLEVDEAEKSEDTDEVSGALSGRPFSTLTRLETLDFSGQRFDSSVIRHLSRKLWSLIIPFESLSAEDCLFLPPFLRCFRIVADFDNEHEYLVDLVPESVDDSLVWEKTPELVARRKARTDAAEARSRLYPDPRTVALLDSR